MAPTTTLDRVAEVEAIITDLEARRLDALLREDEQAFRALFANNAYLELSLEVLGTLEFVSAPDDVTVEVQEILADTPNCLALAINSDLSAALGPCRRLGVLVSGTGWECDGPHPLG